MQTIRAHGHRKEIISACKVYLLELLIFFLSVPMHREIMAEASLFVRNAGWMKMADESRRTQLLNTINCERDKVGCDR